MTINIKKRSLVRFIAFSMAVLTALSVSAAAGWMKYSRERQSNVYNYQRSLLSLSENIDSIDVTLRKTLCAGSAEQFAALAAKLCTDSAAAKSDLAALPGALGELDNVNRFIAQVGDYAISLANKRFLDEELTKEEIAKLKELEGYTEKLRITLEEMIARSADSGVWIEEAEKEMESETAQTSGSASVMADDFTDYPTLIYDGPFSDHIYEKQPALLKGRQKVSIEEAEKKAHEFSNGKNVEFQRNVGGTLPLYVFGSKNTEIGITVHGGEVAYMVNSRNVDFVKYSEEDAVRAAERFLAEHGFENMKGNYYQVYSNCCVINFTPVENNVTIYPDLIKVTVALDNCETVEFDARDYIMNHYDRTALTPQKTKTEAKEIVSSQLEIENIQLALIPTGGKSEKLCWEFLCELDDTEVLVYVNTENLKEEKILLIIDSENGKLTI